MKKRLERALLATGAAILAGALLGAAPAAAKEQVAMLTSFGANMVVGEPTGIPVGHARFCMENPRDCGPAERHGAAPGGKVALTEANYAQLRQVNDDINRRIEPMTDLDHYGEVERWTYPEDGYGDCEDYVLLKRRTLIGLGWPADTLLITVVRDHKGDGHAVLTAVTDRGDLVLDNQEAALLLWHETGYRFVKRQAQEDTDRWVSLGDVLAPLTVGRY